MHGGDIYTNEIEYDFSVNLNPYAPYENIIDAAKDAINDLNVYPQYRSETLVKKLSEIHSVSKGYLCVTNGASEAISEVLKLSNIDSVLLEVPSFYGYEHSIKNHQIITRLERELLLDIDEKKINKNSIVVIANPSNPVGEFTDEDMLNQLYEKVKNASALLMLDESFLPLSDHYNKSFIKKISDNPEYYNRLIIIRSFTKSFSIPGIRLGYVVSSNKDIINEIDNSLPEWNVSRIAQVVGEASLDTIDRLKDDVEKIIESRNILEKELNKLGLKTYKSHSNYLLFEAPKNLYAELLKRKILIRDCSDYYGIDKYITEENMGLFRVAVKKEIENKILINSIKNVLAEKR